MARALINVPAKAKRGEVITIKTLISHVMETGFRHTIDRRARSRATSSIRSCAPTTARRFSAPRCIPPSPPIRSSRFHTVATESGTLTFKWTGDGGFSQTETASIVVE